MYVYVWSDDSIKLSVERTLHLYKSQLRGDLDIPTAAHLSYYLVEKTVHDTILNSKDPENADKVIQELRRMLILYLVREGP